MAAKDPVDALKRSIHDLEARVPEMNAALFELRGQRDLAEAELTKVRDTERELVEKIGAAVARDRHDVALNYAVTLGEVRREVERRAHAHEVAREAFARAQRHKRAHLAEAERRIAEAKDALATRRLAEWRERVAASLRRLRRSSPPPAAHDELVQALRARAAEAEASLAAAVEDLDPSAEVDRDAARLLLDALRREVDHVEERLGATRRQLEALERRFGPG
ncbi:MAG: hypothetical protein M9894_39930 [Planctomycetes bacterium]|nr:hypothetical protein [Planctomycetota bacterium]